MSLDTRPETTADRPLRRVLAFAGLGVRPMILPILLGAAGALSALGLAALSAWLITRAWQMPPVLYLSVAVTAVRALGISRALFRYLERLATHDLALGMMATARERIYRALASGAPGYSVGLSRSAMLARTADDIDEVGDALIRGLIPMGVGAVTSLTAVIIMAVVSPWAAVVLAAALLVSGVLAPWLATRASVRQLEAGAQAREQVAAATGTLLWHGPELVVAGRRDRLFDELSAAEHRLARATDRSVRRQVLASSATPLALGASVLAAALIGVHLASGVSGSLAGVSSVDGVLTPMALGILLLLPLSSFETTGPLTEAGIAVEKGRQAAGRVMALVDGAEGSGEVTDPATDPRPATLTLSGLQWGWDRPLGPAAGVDDVLEPGDRLTVVGPSGVGKSTLLLTLAGLLPPLGGTVTAAHDDGAPADLRAVGCYFAEEAHVFSTTVRENLLVARGDADEQALHGALAQVGLADWVAALPDGLDTPLTGGDGALSGGQRRRLLLARALLHPAPIVLLDEPTEHLSADDARSMMSRICASGPGSLFGADRTVVVVTHQHADLAARTLVLHTG